METRTEAGAAATTAREVAAKKAAEAAGKVASAAEDPAKVALRPEARPGMLEGDGVIGKRNDATKRIGDQRDAKRAEQQAELGRRAVTQLELGTPQLGTPQRALPQRAQPQQAQPLALPAGGTASGTAGLLAAGGVDDHVTASGALCADTHYSCMAWTRAGECARNPKFMRASCAISCGLCRAGR